jgi:uncharacterized protein (DUF302 family)
MESGEEPMAASEAGLNHVSSPYSVAETLQRLESLISARGLKLFARIDHSGEAEKAALKMNPAQLLIFGSPVAGTPLMVAAPTSAIDLPLKVLVWKGAEGAVHITYNSPEYLGRRHGIPGELLKNISGVGPLVEKALQ